MIVGEEEFDEEVEETIEMETEDEEEEVTPGVEKLNTKNQSVSQ